MLRLLRVLSHVPPPLLFVAPLVLGLRVNDAWPQTIVGGSVARVTSSFGIAIIVASVGLALSAIGLFVRRRTTIVPHHRSRALVTSGPFRLTRNPMYVALSCLFVGICLFTNAAWPLALLALPLVYLQTITIPREERQLYEAFGAEYRAYVSRVRRWL
jgi:protein-S-isoprenylcysteine O-methyltransferase Ste14